jgi:hypothetical protein
MTTLLDLTKHIEDLDDQAVLFVKEPWSPTSEAALYRLGDDYAIPPEPQQMGFKYFIEVDIAKEFISGWLQNLNSTPSAEETCGRLIHYALHDA